jgi:hypothetical protein
MLGFQAFYYSVIMIITIPMWLANPMFWFSLSCFANRKFDAAATYGVCAVGLGLSESWMFWKGLSIGYFAWVGSMALLAGAAILLSRKCDPFSCC